QRTRTGIHRHPPPHLCGLCAALGRPARQSGLRVVDLRRNSVSRRTGGAGRHGVLILMRALLIWLALLAPDAKQVFEDKCLYCHSSTVIRQRRLKPSQWRAVVAKMQARAPLLIGHRDTDVIVRYIVRELRLVPPRATPVATAKPAE